MNNLIKDIKLIIYNKKLLTCLIIFLITICAVCGTYRYKGYNKQDNAKGIKIGIANNDDSPYSELLLNFFKSNESFLELAQIVEDNELTVEAEFQAGGIDAYIIIPKDFSDSLMDLEMTGIKIRVSQEKEAEAIILKAVLNSYEKYVTSVQNNAVGLYSNLKKSGLKRSENMKINLSSSWQMVYMALDKESYFDYKVIKQKNIGLIEHYVYTIMLMFIIYYGIYVGIQIKNEQRNSVLKLYKIGKGNILSYILSKIFVNGMALAAFLIIPTIIWSKTLSGNVHIGVITYILLNIAMYISTMVMLSFVIIDKNIYVLISNGMALLCIIVGGGIIPYAYMPENMQKFIEYMPIKIFEDNFNNNIFNNISNNYYVYIIASLASIIVGLLICVVAVERRAFNERN